jgi:hypothetical protein
MATSTAHQAAFARNLPHIRWVIFCSGAIRA